MTSLINKSLILNRIKFIKKMSTDKELAELLEITVATLSNWRRRDSIDYDLILSKCRDIDTEWLIYGENLHNLTTSVDDNSVENSVIDHLQRQEYVKCNMCKEKDKLIEAHGKIIHSLEDQIQLYKGIYIKNGK